MANGPFPVALELLGRRIGPCPSSILQRFSKKHFKIGNGGPVESEQVTRWCGGSGGRAGLLVFLSGDILSGRFGRGRRGAVAVHLWRRRLLFFRPSDDGLAASVSQSMTIHVQFELVLTAKGLLATVTLERAFAGMDPTVPLEVSRSGKRSRAYVATEGFLSRVGSDVRPQLGRPLAVLEAERTDGLDHYSSGSASTALLRLMRWKRSVGRRHGSSGGTVLVVFVIFQAQLLFRRIFADDGLALYQDRNGRLPRRCRRRRDVAAAVAVGRLYSVGQDRSAADGHLVLLIACSTAVAQIQRSRRRSPILGCLKMKERDQQVKAIFQPFGRNFENFSFMQMTLERIGK